MPARPLTRSVGTHARPPSISLELIAQTGLSDADPIIDIGGGASTLVDVLLERGFRDVSVLDVSEIALAHSRARLGPRGGDVHWICGDLLTWAPARSYGLWHDHAVFHFLVKPGDQRRYVHIAAHGVPPGGWLILATFAPAGPAACSGLPVVRWSADDLAARFAPAFLLVDTRREAHITPSGRIQPFTWALLQRANVGAGEEGASRG